MAGVGVRQEYGLLIPIWAVLGVFGAILGVSGCNQSPSRVSAPGWEPDAFADAILEKLDTSGDGALDSKEFGAAPGLAWGAKYIDTDKNGALSRDELVARFQIYEKMRLGLTSKQVQLLMNRRPLVGAKIQLVPEFFLAEVLEPASGETFDDGSIAPQTEGVDLNGVRVGYYRVVVVDSPRMKVPAAYQSAETTPLGLEISPISDDAASYGTIRLNIQGS